MHKKIKTSIFFICKLLCLQKKSIVYHSFPDFSDNSFAAFVYASENLPDPQAIWLVDKIENIEKGRLLIKNYTKTTKTIIVKKKSIKGFFYYLSSDIIFHTHGLYNFFGLIPNQKKINLWHGMPLKTIGYLDNPKSKNVQISNYHVATSPFYQKIMSQAFGVPTNRVLTVGQPRNDFFLKKIKSIHSLFDDNKIFDKTLLWMPTYRKSFIGDIRTDGNPSEDIFFSTKNLVKINALLRRFNAICYIKFHPMDIRVKNFRKHLSNIRFLTNELFEAKSINLYSVLNSVDLLLTDFSSVYIDFLLLDKPIAFVFSDFEMFKKTRGFIFANPEKFMPGEKITNQEELLFFLKRFLKNDTDDYKEFRQKVMKKFHTQNKDFSKTLFKSIAP